MQLLKNVTFDTGSYGAVCKAKYDQLICAAKPLYSKCNFLIQTKDTDGHFVVFNKSVFFLSCINRFNIMQYLRTYRDLETNAPVLLMELMDESLTHFLESSPGDIPYHIQVNLFQDITQSHAQS